MASMAARGHRGSEDNALERDFSGELDAKYSGERDPLEVSAREARKAENESSSTGSKRKTRANGVEESEEPFRYRHNGTAKTSKAAAGKLGKRWLKIAPTGGIMSIFVAGIAMLIFTMAPATQINHIIETLTNRYDMGGMTATRRTNLIWAKKLGNKTVGERLGITARYRNMSTKTVDGFTANGFTLLNENNEIITSKASGKNAVFKILDDKTGKTYGASDITKAMETDVNLRNRVDRVYKPRVAVWFDNVAAKFKQRFGLTKNNAGVKVGDADDVDAINKQISEQTSERANTKARGDGSRLDDDDPDADRKAADNDEHARQLQEAVDEFDGTNGKAIAVKVLKGLSVLSVVQSICDVLTFVNIMDFMVKDAQTEQLMQGFQLFGAEGDKAKTGEQTNPEVMTALGNRLNEKTTCENEDGTITVAKSGTEGQAYRWAAYNERVEEQDCSSSQFMAGGVSGLSPVAKFVTGVASLSMGLCSITNNLVVRITTTVVGIGLSIATFGFGTIASQAVHQFARSQLFNYVGMFVMHMAVKILAGKILGPDLAGQDYLNAIVVGAGALHGKAAAAGGNLALSNEKAAELRGEYDKYIAQVAEDERYNRSPFDVSSKYTFLGSIVAKLQPFTSGISGVGSVLTSMGSVIRATMVDLTPATEAFSLVELKEASAACKDSSYKDSYNLATDPWCNVIYGVDAVYLEEDPEKVLELLEERGEISMAEDGTPKVLRYYSNNQASGRTGLSLYEEQCVNRKSPLAITAEMGGNEGTGANCILKDGEDGKLKTYYALYFIDGRIEDGIDGRGLQTQTQTGVEKATGSGCNNAQDCANKLMELYKGKKVTATTTSTWPKNIEAMSKTGAPQLNACSEDMTVAVPLVDTLLRMAGKYSYTIESLGFLNDSGAQCNQDSPYMKGQAVSISAISDTTGKMETITWNSGQIGLITDFAKGFLDAARNTRPRMIKVGQASCSVEFASAVENMALDDVELIEGSCNHLQLVVIP